MGHLCPDKKTIQIKVKIWKKRARITIGYKSGEEVSYGMVIFSSNIFKNVQLKSTRHFQFILDRNVCLKAFASNTMQISMYHFKLANKIFEFIFYFSDSFLYLGQHEPTTFHLNSAVFLLIQLWLPAIIHHSVIKQNMISHLNSVSSDAISYFA